MSLPAEDRRTLGNVIGDANSVFEISMISEEESAFEGSFFFV